MMYRGWWVLVGLMIVYAVSNGLMLHTLPILYPALIDEFGWDNVQVTLPATVLYVVGALTSPPAGVLLDRYSPRLIMSVGTGGLVVALIWMSRVSELWHLVGVYALFAVSLSLCGLVASMVIVTRWFDGRRGRATGFLLLASSFGGAVFPWLVALLIEQRGWRASVLLLAAIAGALFALALKWLVRSRPGAGDGQDFAADVSPGPMKPTGPTLAASLKSPIFYFVAVATATVWFTVVPLVQHQSIYLAREVGVDRSLLPAIFSTFFAASMAGKLAAGWLCDHLNKHMALIASVAVMAAGLVMLRGIDAAGSLLLFTYAVVAGLGFSAAFTTIQVLVASHFAGPSYGKILAIIMLIDTLAGGLGTRVIAGISESRGSYVPAIDTMIGACALAIALSAAVYLFVRSGATRTAATGSS